MEGILKLSLLPSPLLSFRLSKSGLQPKNLCFQQVPGTMVLVVLGSSFDGTSDAGRQGDGTHDLSNAMLESFFFFLILGVSNWGGYALACALYILNSCEVHERYLRKAVGPSRAPGEQNWAQALPSITKVTDPPQAIPMEAAFFLDAE